MKNRAYYVLYLLYLLMVAFILYINGVFTGDISSMSNIWINVGFLAVIGVIFLISFHSFRKLNRCTDALEIAADKLKKEYHEKGNCLWGIYREKETVFGNSVLDDAFARYQKRLKGYETRSGLSKTCDLEEYINEDLLDNVGMSFFNSAIPGTLTGLGILGTFLGLSLGLGSFSGNDIYTISDNVGVLLSGMKVAFHTSVYGIFFSLVFNFVYRMVVSEAYAKLSIFLGAFRESAMPEAGADMDAKALLIYQANMANSLKDMTTLLKGNLQDQMKGVDRMVRHFQEQLAENMGSDFSRLGEALNRSAEAQSLAASNFRSLEETARNLLETNSVMQRELEQSRERQESLARELEEQKGRLADTCRTLDEEISNQLYTYSQMRNLDEK